MKETGTPSDSPSFFDKWDCDRAFQGKFVAKAQYLNIPEGGSGFDGNPNISIEIDDAIRDAVRNIVEY